MIFQMQNAPFRISLRRLVKGVFPAFLFPRALPLFLFFLLCRPLIVAAFDMETCIPCHGASIGADDGRPYLHSPFALRQCASCHISVPGPGAANAKKPSAKKTKQKVIWLGDSVIAENTHGFVLPGNKLGEVLVVDRKGMDGRIERVEIPVPHLGQLTEVPDLGAPPVISDLKVLKVQRGVFLSVTVGWWTDTLTTASVRYGEKGLTQVSDPLKRFSRRHRVVLYNLKPDTDYQFAVQATDLFGRDQTSEKRTFSTSEALDADSPASGSIVESTGNKGLTSSFQKFKGDYLVELSSPKPFLAFVGSMGEVRRRLPDGNGADDVSGIMEPHKGLSSEIYVTMNSCRNCHRQQNTVTHPVNVFPKPGMTIPPEYPTLPDGRITCASCHFTHSSDFENLAIKPGRRELCVGCHKDML